MDVQKLNEKTGYFKNSIIASYKLERNIKKEEYIDTGYCNRIIIYGNNLDKIPTQCKRKKARKRKQIKNPLMNHIKIKSQGIGEYFGFELDGNHRFILDNFIVTHNSKKEAEQVASRNALKKYHELKYHELKAHEINNSFTYE